MESIFRRGRIECLVNPTLGREKEMELKPAETPKKVMVIGGGPGGLHVAWVAASRGHEVHLYEKQLQLGGQLNLGSVTKYKKELLSLIGFQKRQVEKSDIKTHLNFEVTLDTVDREKPDVVVLSTGSIPVRPPIPGIDKPIVRTLAQVFDSEHVGEMKTVVVGGGATGCEVAHHLSESGCSVSIVEQLDKLAGQLESITRKVLLRQLRDNNVQFLTGCTLAKIEDHGVVIITPEGKEQSIEAEAVVIAIGNRPDNSLFEQIKSTGIPVYQIGDCLEPRSAKAAIFEAADIGRAI
jgi:NADPH-dependent 2,4-dienoyl-CoA reductase/sulfur reductase-like enzyme